MAQSNDDQSAIQEARKYASRITEYADKIEALIASNSLVEAAETATKAKDMDKLEQIAKLAKTPAARDAVEKGMTLLGGK